MVKLTRALWIIPMAFVTSIIFKNKGSKIHIPWFIFFFVLAMILNTFIPLPEILTESVVWLAHKGLTITQFFIGASLSKDVLIHVGIRLMIQGVLLWIVIGVSSLGYLVYIV